MNMAMTKSVTFCGVVALVAMVALSPASAAPTDFDGVWLPDVKDQHRQEKENQRSPLWQGEDP